MAALLGWICAGKSAVMSWRTKSWSRVRLSRVLWNGLTAPTTESVFDGCYDVALAGKIFRQVSEERAGAGVTVRNDDEGEGLVG